MKIPWWAAWVVTAVAVVGYLALWFLRAEFPGWLLQVAVVGLGYPFLIGTSGLVWKFVDGQLENEEPDASDDESGSGSQVADGGSLQESRGPADETASDRTGGTSNGGAAGPDRDVGLVVGKCENVLILTFMVVGAFTALAVVFAAKSIVRGEDMKDNSRYYLAGTMTNVTYSVAVGVGVRVLLQAFDVWPIAFLSTP